MSTIPTEQTLQGDRPQQATVHAQNERPERRTTDMVRQLQQLVVDNEQSIDGNRVDFLSNAAQAFERSPQLQQVNSVDLRRGFDIQGYLWRGQEEHKRLYMEYRRSVYPRFQGIPHNTLDVQSHAGAMAGGEFFRFRFSQLGDAVRSQISHFQLRDLIWPTSSYDVFFWHAKGLQRWNPWQKTVECVLESRWMPQSFKISALCVNNGVAVAGDHRGRLCVQSLWGDRGRWPAEISLGADIISHIAPANSLSHASVLVAHNAGAMHTVDLECMRAVDSRTFPWAVNSCAQARDGSHMQCVVGDDTSGQLLDSRMSSSVVSLLGGHQDYIFACDFSPDSRIVATGCQDSAVRIFDLRWTAAPVEVMCGNLGAMRSVRFSGCGRFLVGAEPADYVHVWETAGFGRSQVIEVMGEVAGAAFSPDSQCLFVGVADALHGCALAEFTALDHPF
ncbi:hypothetical protein LPJ66_009578 [Kickxella alabastrina]|uniref:Uncharacterized protein n=1 Tax=Kickxella alabastrina TaxID=61397 RepID=A0ACC1I6Q4_9FUNG|nr:hypothetical protein LPJ66_009578 [Kickxella alabastrina]